ncbi:MAG: hypothetical protein ACYC0H_17080, partial [Solirubrobacteraceae bacterium]
RHAKRCTRSLKLHVSFKLSATAKVTVTVQRLLPGRRVKRRCVAPSRHNRRAGHCTRLVRLQGKLTTAARRGVDRFVFDGRIGRRRLGPGTYLLIVAPAGGQATRAKFTLRGP